MLTKDFAQKIVRQFVPNAGTIIIVLALLWAHSAGAFPFGAQLAATSTTTISYQGRLAEADGAAVDGNVGMTFRIYNAATGGSPLWTETYGSVPVSDGLFHVLLGSVTALPQSLFGENETLYLGVTVGADDEMVPREQLASAPWAMGALTVPDGAITTEKIADGAVTSAKQTPRLRIVTIPLGNDDIGGVTTYKHLGHMASFTVGHTHYARGAIKLPNDWVPGTDLRIGIAAQSSTSAQTIAPRVYWATLNTTDVNWEVENSTSPNVTIATGISDITLVVIPNSQVAAGDTVAIAFRFPGNTQTINVTGLYLEYTAQP